jgi:hypothetical protein
MNTYGESITWSMDAFTGPITGDAQNYSYRAAYSDYMSPGQDGAHAAMVLHGHKGEISFESLISPDTDNIPNLSLGARIAISAISAGLVLCRSVSESWRDRQSKSVSLSASHYPAITAGTGAEPGAIAGFTPADQAGISIYPAGRVIWSTIGLGHTSGKIRAFTIDQSLEIAEETDPLGAYCAVATHSYQRSITLEILSTGTRPALDTILTVTGAPAHASGYAITSSEEMLRLRQGKLYRVEAMWIPAMAA